VLYSADPKVCKDSDGIELKRKWEMMKEFYNR